LTNNPKLEAILKQLPALVKPTLESGNALAMAVIDQEFEEIPTATQSFDRDNEKFDRALASARDAAVADFKLFVGQMTVSSIRGARVNLWFSSGLIVLTIGLLIYLLASVVRPIGAVVASLKDVAQGEGDLTRRIPDNRKDEIGELSKWFNVFIEKLQGIIKDISGGVETLSSCSTELSAISEQMSQSIQNVSEKTHTVSAAAEKMNTNMNNVAAAMEQSAININMVTTASEEMSATIG
jgi:methyl-accepting chemotaxis protein